MELTHTIAGMKNKKVETKPECVKPGLFGFYVKRGSVDYNELIEVLRPNCIDEALFDTVIKGIRELNETFRVDQFAKIEHKRFRMLYGNVYKDRYHIGIENPKSKVIKYLELLINDKGVLIGIPGERKIVPIASASDAKKKFPQECL